MIGTALAAFGARMVTSTAWPWIRLIALIVGSIALAFAWVRVQDWRAAYHEREETKAQLVQMQAALKLSRADLKQCTDSATAAAIAYSNAVQLAETTATADRAEAARIQHALTSRLTTAGNSARDLARQLHDYQARWRSLAASTTAGTAGDPAGACGEPGDGGAVEVATADHFAACARDAARLDAWREWWAGVAANWRAAGLPVGTPP